MAIATKATSASAPTSAAKAAKSTAASATIKQLSSKNYNLFHMNSVNRAAEDGEPLLRADLLKSMKAHGFRKTNPIICVDVEGEFLIVDGHNRFAVAKSLNLPIEYLVYPKEDYVNPLEFSLGQKAWSGREIVEGYSKSGNENYREIVEFCEEFGVPFKAALSMHRGNLPSSNNFQRMVREGRYEITDRDFPRKVAYLWRELGKHSVHARTLHMLNSLAKALMAKGFSDKTLLDKVKKYPDLIHKCRTVDETVQMLEEVYNRGSRGEKYYLTVEVEKAMRARNQIMNTDSEAKRAIAKAKARMQFEQTGAFGKHAAMA